MSEESIALPLRERVVRRVEPTTPEGVMDRARDDAEALLSAAHAEIDALREGARSELRGSSQPTGPELPGV